MLVEFPARRVRRHGLASAQNSLPVDFLAAKAVKRSAVIPASLVVAEPSNADHHSDGTLSRCHHLLTCDGVAPISEAHASLVAQSSMIERNDGDDSAIAKSLGQFVLKSKAKLSCDLAQVTCDCGQMAGKRTETEEKMAFIARVRSARIARFDSQGPMCTILGVTQGTYKQYERRTPLPHRFIPRFCAATGVTYEWLLAAEGNGPPIVALPPPRRPGKRQKSRTRAA